MKIIKALGSLSFAIFLISTLALILIISTTMESLHGTPFAQKIFYTSRWFDLLLSLFFVNIFFSTLTRWPFKKHHTGFVVTHIGILLFLTGCLLSRLLGVEGQLALVEGESRNQILQSAYQIVAKRPGDADSWTGVLDLDPSGKPSGKLEISDSGIALEVEEIWEDAVELSEMIEGPADAPANAGIRFTLASERAGFQNSLSLVEKDPLEPHSAKLDMGPATFSLSTVPPPAQMDPVNDPGPRILIRQPKTGKTGSFGVEPLPKTPFALGDTGLSVTEVHYFPDARVENNKVVSVSDKADNPAVEFVVIDPEGSSEHHTKFAFFPEFKSLRGKAAQDHFGLEVNMELPETHASPGDGRKADLTFYNTAGKWSFVTKASSGRSSGSIEEGKTYPAGWMDFSFRVDELLERAVIRRSVRHSKPGEQGSIAVRVAVREKGRTLASEWITVSKPFRYESQNGPLVAVIKTKRYLLPFSLELKDFRKVDYPGTSNAASFESDVTLNDESEKLSITKTISMNKPLDHKGFRIFQSSYSLDPEGGPDTSIFTVAKNPGITLIYAGAVILFLGVVIIFYIRPLSSFSQLKPKGVKK